MSETAGKFRTSLISLKTRLGLGAAALGVAACLTALILWLGMGAVSARLETALAAESRMSRYATLSQQAATFLVVATEAIQSELSPEIRVERIVPIADQMRRTFEILQQDVETAVNGAAALGLDQQSRYGTQSLGIARMEAMLEATLRGLQGDTLDKARLRAFVDTFASNFDPLLNQAVNTEVLFRNDILTSIETLRLRLTNVAIGIGVLSLLSVGLFHFGLVRPQFRRLDDLRQAARRIGQADFFVDLPKGQRDEIGQLFQETNRMAAALSKRQDDVEAEWKQLNDTIAQRTAALRAANTRLSEIDENRRRFFADVSHELRTPLTVILMEAQIGMKETANPAFETIEARAARLNRRIDDLLRVARSDSGQLVLEPHEVDLSVLLTSAIEETQAEIDNAGLMLEVALEEDGQVSCDANWIRQVVVSLIRNAIGHARDGGALRVAAGAGADHITIEVIDNGPGIPPSEQPGIFERFAKGRDSREPGVGQTSKVSGFGIGLALVRWVIEAHGGSIYVVSPVPRDAAIGSERGTKVGLRLPRQSA